MSDKLVSCWGYPLAVSGCHFINVEYGTIVYDQFGHFLGKYETESAAVEEIRALVKECEGNGGLISEI